MNLPPPRKLNADLLRYYLDVFHCAKIVGASKTIAVSTFPGGFVVGELGADECRTFTSLEAALRGFIVNPDSNLKLAGFLDDQTNRVEPPEAEE
jgi:hypothetical protein